MGSTEHDRGGSERSGRERPWIGRPVARQTRKPSPPQLPRAYALKVRIGENRAITDTVPSSTWDWITWPISL